ncbi:MAG: hypothetical protein IIA49_17415 [Bacteroidetes bacterium]|nr:hypothetical protein [Bacteroidota bacterium]
MQVARRSLSITPSKSSPKQFLRCAALLPGDADVIVRGLVKELEKFAKVAA